MPPPPPPPPTATIPGIPPPPCGPPLPGAWRSNYLAAQEASFTPTATMPSIRPKKKLKALHWEKIDTPQVTVWASHAPSHEEKEQKYHELAKKGVLDEVERLFMAKETKILGGGASVKQRQEKKQIVSNELSKHFQIAMAKFSQIPVDDLIRMIIDCDHGILDNNVIMDFLQKDDLCTIPENTAKLMAPYRKDWTVSNPDSAEREQDPSELTREDQIYLQTAFELNHYWKSRMRALALTRSFEPDYDHISQKLQEVVGACESLRDSVSLMNILGLILDIGNFMNDANKQAQGFKLSSLARLGMVKDDKNETTFADLVERIVRNQYPEWEGFVDELGGVLGVQKLNVDQLRTDAKKYIDTIKYVQMSLDSGNLSDPKKFHPQDRVSQVVQRSMKDARRKAEQMQIYLSEMTKTYDDIMTFYGEDNADENARRDFFGKLAAFLQEWKKSREKNIALEGMRKRTEASLARKRMNPGQSNGNVLGSDSQTSPSTSGAMDSLLEKLRAAAPQARDQRDRRRRARLKERHQVRVASGQKMPHLYGMGDPKAEEDDVETGPTGSDTGLLSPKSQDDEENSAGRDAQASESEDIADRAASMLQGLRNADTDADRARRRRESAEDERRNRRMRRRTPAVNGSKDSADGSLPSLKEFSPAAADAVDIDSTVPLSPPLENSPSDTSTMPAIVVSSTPEQGSGDESLRGSSPDNPVEVSDP
ncbi:hypothetical protein V8E54_008606 [Elaphomyces granulatus]